MRVRIDHDGGRRQQLAELGMNRREGRSGIHDRILAGHVRGLDSLGPVTREITSDIAMLERLVAPAGTDVLDIGCGSGALVRELCARGARARGLEISEAQLAGARERDPDGPDRYLVGRAEALPLPDASLDIVVFMRALHHIPVEAMTAALGEARRVLRSDGTVYVAEPLPEGSFYELTRLVEDELEVRRAAQDAVARAEPAGLARATTIEYTVAGRYTGVEAFCRHMVSVDPGGPAWCPSARPRSRRRSRAWGRRATRRTSVASKRRCGPTCCARPGRSAPFPARPTAHALPSGPRPRPAPSQTSGRRRARR